MPWEGINVVIVRSSFIPEREKPAPESLWLLTR
jgi:hypothetical protein